MKKLKFKDTELAGVAILAAIIGVVCDDWMAGASIVVLWIGAKLLITGDGIPVLFLAFLYQWGQVTVGVFYLGFFGRAVPTVDLSDYRPMVLIGLGCVLCIAVGIRGGMELIENKLGPIVEEGRPDQFLTWPMLLTAYGVGVAFEGLLIQFSGNFPSLRQVFLTLTIVRMGLLFLIFRRLCSPTFHWVRFVALLTVEVALGFTGFFAGFREPLALGVMALLEIFNYKRAAHLVSLTGLLVVMTVSSVMWMGVRANFRRDFAEVDAFSSSQSARMDRITALGQGFFQSDAEDILLSADNLVDRMWVVYYPALAVTRVPSVIPHTNGSITWAAIMHVLTPRVFFPGKEALLSDSEMVRKYSGLYVAGQETGTSIAFGYAAEEYIDFGLPLMFLPILVFGVIAGCAYAWFGRAIRHRELAVAMLTVIFWMGLYLFERSSANTLGNFMSLVVYVGIPAIFLDKFLLLKVEQMKQSNLPYTVTDVPDAMQAIDRLR